jgi:hypothetical protein
MESGVEYRPTVTQNGHTERSNPSRALSGNAGEGDQAVCRDGVGVRSVRSKLYRCVQGMSDKGRAISDRRDL